MLAGRTPLCPERPARVTRAAVSIVGSGAPFFNHFPDAKRLPAGHTSRRAVSNGGRQTGAQDLETRNTSHAQRPSCAPCTSLTFAR
jgi:hypothetical protein